MKRVIKFSGFFLPAMVLSLLLVGGGIAAYIVMDGFNLGIDFKAGQIQELRIAPRAFSITYSGKGNAMFSFTRSGLELVISGPDTDGATYNFNFAEYTTLDSLVTALKNAADGVNIETEAPGSTETAWFIQNAHGNPQINSEPYEVHYLEPGSPGVESEVRESLASIEGVSVQVLGVPSNRHFLIRMDEAEADDVEDADDVEEAVVAGIDSDDGSGGEEEADISAINGVTDDEGEEAVTGVTDDILSRLEETFGAGEVVITRSDFVGSRFSRQLADQAGILMFLTLLLILVYASVRFKPQFAIGAVLAIAHDALIMVAFITWSRMEFNTTTIAAILTILGYSINDTIVVFDRIREVSRLYPDDGFTALLNRAITETFGRTIITTLTTMLAVLSLYVFTSGSMKDFALALLVGMVSGVYSTIFIACGFTAFWQKYVNKGKRIGAVKGPVKAAVKTAGA
ncbi:MAG: protein translocase subunit SecF [Spirochaetaceae bacterium]|jgi:preprotein translocase subunit SecF|nr:protein translocase subunit SecF [Spirochaetaceae bacterium]